jgi:hypothetical protein
MGERGFLEIIFERRPFVKLNGYKMGVAYISN